MDGAESAASRTQHGSEVAVRDAVPGIVTNSPAMRALVDLASRVAAGDSTVLVVGERGSGKERIARFVHAHSSRAGGPFIAVNCGAMTEPLLESELFGHARGAFARATHDRAGLFETAIGGSLVLDQLDEVSPALQIKLFRALQTREGRRVGERKTRTIDVRLLATTDRQPTDGGDAGTFLRGLYQRLNVVELRVPPLRERSEDILPLAHMLLADAAARMKRTFAASFGPAVAELLLQYGWPGNIRELANAMERAAALGRGDEVVVEDLVSEIRRTATRSAIRKT